MQSIFLAAVSHSISHSQTCRTQVSVCTYCVNLVVFVLGIDVFNICYNVCVQSLWGEKSQCLVLTGEEGNNRRAHAYAYIYTHIIVYLCKKKIYQFTDHTVLSL